jgi:HSP20 family protein
MVKVEVPGVDEKDLRVTFEDGLLTITGERQFERKDDRNYHRIERAYGSFTRSFTLPRSVDASQIVANYRNGVLEVEIPKKEESRPKQININVNAGAKQLNA